MYADDLLIIGGSVEMINELKCVLIMNFKMKDLGNLRYFLGIKVTQSSDGIVINQRRYCLELLFYVGLTRSKPVKNPMEVGLKLTSLGYDQLFNLNKVDRVIDDITSYKRLIGKLLYLTITSSDIAFCVQQLSQFLQ